MITIEGGLAIAIVSFLVGVGVQWGGGMVTLKDHTRRITQLENDSRQFQTAVSDILVTLAKTARSIKNEVRKGRVVLVEEDDDVEDSA